MVDGLAHDSEIQMSSCTCQVQYGSVWFSISCGCSRLFSFGATWPLSVRFNSKLMKHVEAGLLPNHDACGLQAWMFW